MLLAVEVYRLSANFPKYEIYGLTSQLRHSAVSVPSNVHGRNAAPDDETRHARFLHPNLPPQAGEGANETLRVFHVNIAEGRGRNSPNEFYHFLGIAPGSLAEVETQIILAQHFDYISDPESEKALQLADEIGKMLKGLQKSLSKTND